MYEKMFEITKDAFISWSCNNNLKPVMELDFALNKLNYIYKQNINDFVIKRFFEEVEHQIYLIKKNNGKLQFKNQPDDNDIIFISGMNEDIYLKHYYKGWIKIFSPTTKYEYMIVQKGGVYPFFTKSPLNLLQGFEQFVFPKFNLIGFKHKYKYGNLSFGKDMTDCYQIFLIGYDFHNKAEFIPKFPFNLKLVDLLINKRECRNA